MRHIVKVGLAVVRDGRLLLVRKRGTQMCILPGGKPEADEDDRATLSRELDEELGCGVEDGDVEFLGSFTDEAAGLSQTTVTVRLYRGRLAGTPSPRSEIEALVWYDPRSSEPVPLAPSIERQILPALFSSAGQSREAASDGPVTAPRRSGP